MSGRMMKSAVARLSSINTHTWTPKKIGTLIAHEGELLEADGLAAGVGTAVRLCNSNGKSVRGEIIGFRGARSLILPFERNMSFATGTPITSEGSSASVACGAALMGRVVDALGDSLDGQGPILSRDHWPLTGRKSNPLHRGRVLHPFVSGVRAIDALLTLGVGQRIAIIAGSGVGKSILMSQILNGSECDVFVIGLVGERSREVSDFVETMLPPSRRVRTVVVAVPADHAPHLRLRAAMRATAIAEAFRNEGKQVLLMIDSLTRVAHAQREIGLSMGEPPTMKGYPPSALGLIPSLIERAGVDRHTGGSITAIYTVLADGGDTEDPVVDTARAIVDGHIVLSRHLAEQGLFPAIDVSKSLSRTMADVVDPDHLSAAARFRRLWATYEDNRDLMLMGAYSLGNDHLLDLAIQQRPDMEEFLSQRPDVLVRFDASRDALIEKFAS
jgi:flagellum-specific ATP synthase